MGNRCANHVTPLYPQKLALTSPTGGGRSVGMVRLRTKATEFSFRSHRKFVFQRKRTYSGKRWHLVALSWLRSEAWVCGLLLVGIAGLNTMDGMDIALLV